MSQLKFDATQVATIFETSDFKQFSIKKGNRQVNTRHVKKLVKEISNKDLKIPIEVDSEMNIVDGQHRFFAYKQLNKKFRFFVTPSVVEVKDIQKQNNIKLSWVLDDHLHSQIQLNNDHYVAFKKFCETYNLGINDALLIFGVSKDTFKDGRFKISDLSTYEIIANNCNLVFKNWDKSIDSKVKSGLISFLKTYPKADVSLLIQKMIKYPSKYFICTKMSEYNEMFLELYNYGLTNKNRLKK